MDKKKALLNVFVSLFFRTTILIISLFSRRYLIAFLGSEANGIYSLFVSIVGILSIAELGIGTSITFSMYKPIVSNDRDTLSALLVLFKKIYLIIGTIILLIGLAILPFLPNLAKNNTGQYNIYFSFLIYLLSVLITYLFAFKTSLINAFKDNYITTIIRSTGLIIEAIIQIIILITLKSFIGFFIAMLLSSILQYVVTNYVYKVRYAKYINSNKYLNQEIKNEVVKNTKAMFMHKIGGVLVDSASSVIISSLIGVIILGKYSNYITIVAGMNGLLFLVFSSLTSNVGHSFAKNNSDTVLLQFKQIYVINIVVGLIFYMGFYTVSTNVVQMLFGQDQILDDSIIFFITVNYFILLMRQTVQLFKNASGRFYHDRFKPIIEGVVSIVLSLILVNYLGIIGVLISHIVTNLFITHIIEPYVLFKYGFKKYPFRYYVINYTLIIVFITQILIYDNYFRFINDNIIKELIVNGSVAVLISITTIAIALLLSKQFRVTIIKLVTNIKNLIIKKHQSEGE